MLDLVKMRKDRIKDYIKEIYTIANSRTDWWKDRKIQERIMHVRNLSFIGECLVGARKD